MRQIQVYPARAIRYLFRIQRTGQGTRKRQYSFPQRTPGAPCSGKGQGASQPHLPFRPIAAAAALQGGDKSKATVQGRISCQLPRLTQKAQERTSISRRRLRPPAQEPCTRSKSSPQSPCRLRPLWLPASPRRRSSASLPVPGYIVDTRDFTARSVEACAIADPIRINATTAASRHVRTITPTLSSGELRLESSHGPN